MSIHVPVMPREVIELLAPKPGETIVDGTLGGGGHSRLIAELVGPRGKVLGLDRDPQAVEEAARSLAGLPVTPIHANYADLPEILTSERIDLVDGVLLDLGLSSDQLADRERGFSFDADGPLDLRFDTTRGEPASRMIARMSPEHLADLIYEYGEERHSRKISRAIVARSRERSISTAAELADIVRRAVPRDYEKRIDPATRTFQALRIAVNEELKWLEATLRRLPGCLKANGRLVVISFHSLEDRLVKNALRDDERLEVITRKPVRPTDEEVSANPRSRSAKMRAALRRP